MINDLLDALKLRRKHQEQTALERYQAIEQTLDDIEAGVSKKSVSPEDFESAANAVGISVDAVAERLKLRAEIRAWTVKRDEYAEHHAKSQELYNEHQKLKNEIEAYIKAAHIKEAELYARYNAAMAAGGTRDWHADKIREAEDKMRRLMPVL